MENVDHCCGPGRRADFVGADCANLHFGFYPQARTTHQPRAASNKAKIPAAIAKKQAMRLRENSRIPPAIQQTPERARINLPERLIFGAKNFPTPADYWMRGSAVNPA